MPKDTAGWRGRQPGRSILAAPMRPDTLVIGAGVAGLSCARELALAGRRVVLLERAAGVGGRCATRRVEDQAVDHGVVFLHGASADFAQALAAVEEGGPLPGWPLRMKGSGRPCQDTAFSPGAFRLAYRRGISAFPKHLARDLDLRLRAPVAHLEAGPGVIRVATGGEGPREAPEIVLALALEQARSLLRTLVLPAGTEAAREIAGADGLLAMVGTLPCLTVLAGYPQGAPPPAWDVLYPEGSRILQLVAHDSAKRRDPRRLVLVAQAHPCWSREHQDWPADEWSVEILAELGRLLGSWAAAPDWNFAHRWRHARVDRGGELRRPLMLRLPGGATIGVTGEAFHPGGGVEGAWRAGREMARRLQGEER